MSWDEAPPEREARIKEQQGREQAEREAHAERRLKGRARVAFLDAGGRDEEFEAAYPALRERMIQDATVRALDGQRRAGGVNPDGTVNW